MRLKNYGGWHVKKSAINDAGNRLHFYERQVWWVAVGRNIGDEEDGKGNNYSRPVLVLRKFNTHLFWGIPLTTTDRTGMYYVRVYFTPKKISTAILSQLRAFDSKRLIRQGGVVSELDFGRVQLGLMNILRAHPKK